MEFDRKKITEKAVKAYRRSDGSRWVFAYFSSKIVGQYGRGGTLGLADDANVSPDTVEDHAHAYWMFDKLQNLQDGAERLFVRTARKLPFIYLSHFRALYDIQISHNLTDEQIMNLLADIVQAEGTISSRNLADHARSKYGDTRTWEYYGAKAMREVNKTLQQPDLPKEGRDILSDAFDWLGDNS